MVEYDFVKVPIVDIVNQIILYAAQHRASDIHFDPLEDALMIRMRIDGDLQNHSLVPKIYERNLITRIKLVSAMNITETRLPQDGAIKGRIGGKDLDMRVSILPTNEGEKCVIRILDFQKGLSGLDALGFTPNNYKKVEKMLAVPNGIILVTGATGSGKSTTTYSMLQALNKEETNLITVEDPIEMNIEGVNQVQVNSEIGMTFAAALRSILRQDPNIILIGEMRDEETAQIAVRAAITGHLVLSTIHTNNALATIERLMDMGVERYMLATSVTGIISQKLARTLCDNCKRLRPTTKYERYMFARVLHKKVKEIYEPVGCSECHQGFKGRIALHEVLYISEHLRDMISDEKVEKEELREEVYGRSDTTTLLQDALEKVLAGYTTFQEIYRVVDIDVDLDNAIKSDMGIEEEQGIADIEEDDDWQNFDGVFDDELEVIDISKEDENDLPTLDTSIVISDNWKFNKQLAPSDPKYIKFFLLENIRIKKIDKDKKNNAIINEFLENNKKEINKDNKQVLLDKLIDEYNLDNDNDLVELYNQVYDQKLAIKEKENDEFRKFLVEYDKKKHSENEQICFQKFLKQYDEKLRKEKENLKFREFLIEYEKKLSKERENEEFRKFLLNYGKENNEKIEETTNDNDYSNYDASQVELKSNNTLDNVIGGYSEEPINNTNNILNLDNVVFNYKEVLELIDAYSNIGPSIQDVVNDDIKRENEEKEKIDIYSNYGPTIQDVVNNDIKKEQS